MRRLAIPAVLAWMAAATGALVAQTTSGLTATPPSMSFSYQVNAAALPATQNLTIAATGSAATATSR